MATARAQKDSVKSNPKITKASKAKATAAVKAAKKPDNIYWVVQYRKFLTWKAHSLYTTEKLAYEEATRITLIEGLTTKVERVALVV